VTRARVATTVLSVPAAAILLLNLACGGTFPGTLHVTPAVPAFGAGQTLRVQVAGRVVTVPLEVYVAGTAVSEVVPLGESQETVDRIYDVQTTIARTYAVAHLGRHQAEGFDLCDSTHCQLYQPGRLTVSRFSGDVRRAAQRTSGNILMYAGRPIDALFHADCGGHTASPEQVWGGVSLPYLRAEADQVPDLTHRSWTVSITRDELRKALNADSRTAVGRKLTSLVTGPVDSSGRILDIRATGDRRVDVRSDDFRAVVNRRLGPKGIQSTRFSLRASASGYVLTGTGYGHGVGLCQLGALARARQGTTAEAILDFYFPGTSIVHLRR
jgi:stage II sporulation protein D